MAYQQTLTGAQQAHPPTIRTIGMADLKDALRKGVDDFQAMPSHAVFLSLIYPIVGLIGFCSGGRHAYLCGCRIPDVNAVVDCWGGNVVVDDKSQLNAKRPVAPIEMTEQLRAPLLGLFGNDDENPNADQVNRTEAALKRLGKNYEFHRYDGAGHAFFNVTRAAYRPEQAADGWRKVFAFYQKHLAA